MKRFFFVIALLAGGTSFAQSPEYVPPDQELWVQMGQAFAQINMPLAAHQAVQQVMQNVEREAVARAAKKKTTGN